MAAASKIMHKYGVFTFYHTQEYKQAMQHAHSKYIRFRRKKETIKKITALYDVLGFLLLGMSATVLFLYQLFKFKRSTMPASCEALSISEVYAGENVEHFVVNHFVPLLLLP